MEKHYYKIYRAMKRYNDALRSMEYLSSVFVVFWCCCVAMALANEELSTEIKNFYQPGAPYEV